MAVRSILCLLVVVGAGCPSDQEQGPAPAQAPAEPAAPAVTIDAGPADATASPPRVAADLHFDDYGSGAPGSRQPRASGREGELELLLRSTPPGAVAAVDGRRVGATPVLWRTGRSGRSSEFTFVLPGYAMARYRFVPTRSGIVHGTLKKLAEPMVDAGPAADAPTAQRKR